MQTIAKNTKELPRFSSVVTHDGVFHADDVLCHVVLAALPIGPFDLVRTRDPEFIAPVPGRLVFDVGGVYDVHRHAYDHHQIDRPKRPDGCPYSAFGLIWSRFGRDYVRNLDPELSPDVVERTFRAVDDGIVSEIDANDNGWSEIATQQGHLSVLVETFVPTKSDASAADYDDAFLEASRVVGRLFEKLVEKVAFELSCVERFDREADFGVLAGVAVLENSFPYGRAVHRGGFEGLKYVISPVQAEGIWFVRAVAEEEGSFVSKVPLPEHWRGLRESCLVAVTGVKDAVFCHATGFVGAARSKEGALSLAQRSLLMSQMLPQWRAA